MKLWLDAQLPSAICTWITDAFGVEAAHIESIGLLEAEDLDLFKAVGRPGSVLVTKDEDFVDLVTRLGPPPQIMWPRVGNCSNASLRLFLNQTLAEALLLLKQRDALVQVRQLPSK